jgi:AraC family transcriptional regulator
VQSRRSCARPTTGSIWLNPIGGKYTHVNIDAPEVEFIGLYLPNIVFACLIDDYNLPAVPARSIRYSGGVQDCQCSWR